MTRTRRMFRTGISGLTATVVDVFTMVALVELAGAAVGIAAFVGAAAGAGVSFAVAKFWAFGDATPVRARQVGAFAMVAGGTAVAMALSVHFLAEVVGIQYLAAKAICAVLIFLCWSYPLQSRVVFRRARQTVAQT